MVSRGRRPAGSDARGQIVTAARVEFSALGYDATSLRAVARRAGVDPALVHHYFQGKAALFAEVMAIPIDPRAVIDAVLATPKEHVGVAMVRAFLTVWDTPEGRMRFQGLIRSALTHEEAARMIREFVSEEVFARVAGQFCADPREAHQRGGLAASQMIGLGMMRYVVAFAPIVDATEEELARWLGPTLQRYLVV